MSWPSVSLGEVCRVEIGRTPSRKQSEYWGGGVPWLSISDMSQGKYLSATKEKITDTAVKKCRCKVVEPGTVLLSFKLSLGRVGIVHKPMCTNEAIAALPILKPESLIPEYLYWALQQIDYRQGQDRAAKGLTLNKPKLQSLKFPLPPINEQRRIAAILDQVEELRAKRCESLDNLWKVPHSLFIETFGDPASKEDKWEHRPLKSLTNKIGSGSTPRGGESAYVPSGTALIRSMNVHDGAFVRKGLAFIDDQQALKMRSVTVEANDVLLNITGASVARVCRAPTDVLPARVNQHVSIIRCNEQLSPIYLENLLLLPSTKRRLLRVAGSGATREAITKKEIEEFLIPVPPMAAQIEYEEMIALWEVTRRICESHMVMLDNFSRATQHRLLGGGK